MLAAADKTLAGSGIIGLRLAIQFTLYIMTGITGYGIETMDTSL